MNSMSNNHVQNALTEPRPKSFQSFTLVLLSLRVQSAQPIRRSVALALFIICIKMIPLLGGAAADTEAPIGELFDDYI